MGRKALEGCWVCEGVGGGGGDYNLVHLLAGSGLGGALLGLQLLCQGVARGRRGGRRLPQPLDFLIKHTIPCLKLLQNVRDKASRGYDQNRPERAF